MKKPIIFLGLVLSIFRVDAQQLGMLTQFMYGKSTINPAFVGIERAPELGIFMRQQWIGLDGAPSIQILSFDTPFSREDNGAGFILQRQKLGVNSTTRLMGQYAYKIRLANKGFLSMGLQAGLENFRLNYNDPDLYIYDGLIEDPTLVNGTFSHNAFVLGLGIYYRGRKSYFGISAPTIYTQSFSEEEIRSKSQKQISIMGGYLMNLTPRHELIIQGHSKYVPEWPINFEFNANLVTEDTYECGLSYRLSSGFTSNLYKAVALTLGVKILEQTFVSLSYDYDLSRLQAVQWGSIELSARYQIKRKEVINPGINPRFF